MKYSKLTDTGKKKLITEEHIKKKKSILKIAEEYETYPNRIFRDAKRLGLKTRSKSEAQKNALSTGVLKHPTKDKKRSQEEKRKIGQSVTKTWVKASKEEKKRRSKISKKNWEKRSQDQVRNMKERSIKGILKASKEGSKLEKHIRDCLVNDGYEFEYHVSHVIADEKMHIDILLSDPVVAIEIDGPMHNKRVWDDEVLSKNKERDQKKNGLLISEGISVIRVKYSKRNFSFSRGDKIYQDILREIRKVDSMYPQIYRIGE